MRCTRNKDLPLREQKRQEGKPITSLDVVGMNEESRDASCTKRRIDLVKFQAARVAKRRKIQVLSSHFRQVSHGAALWNVSGKFQ